MRRDHRPSGQSLVELVVALLLLALFATTALGLLTAELGLFRDAADATEAGNAARFAARLLHSEIATLTAADSRGFDADSSRQRVFRGAAIVCAVAATTATVRYIGLRAPDPAKDSALVLTTAGETSRPVAAASPASVPGCSPGPSEIVLELDLGTGLQTGDLLLLFETGTWHLSGSALRYARGAGGRQPLTPEVFLDDSTRITADSTPGGPVAVRLALAAMPVGRPVAARLIRESSRIALLNLAAPLDSVVLR